MLSHIHLIEKAISEYLIVGAKAFRQAGRSALGEMIEVKDEISIDNEDTDILRKLDMVWKKVNNAADVAIKTEKIAKISQGMYNFFLGFFN